MGRSCATLVPEPDHRRHAKMLLRRHPVIPLPDGRGSDGRGHRRQTTEPRPSGSGIGRAPIRPGSLLVAILVALLFLADCAKAASVGPAGYTNAFSSQPSSADWATFTRTGVAT